ncbi:MAG: hypothetical protein IJE40_00115, partial [Clostridia bacterium]|nr:hypothetical protein [Clostridia bacterium]
MRRFISTVLAAVIAMSVILSLPISFSAESMYIRKIVSVVYDDSGSMTWDDNGNDCMDKWAYANYAMQAFCGMLNSEDQLFITYMDDSTQKPNYKPEQINLSANGIQDSVDSIRNHSGGGGTPYASVEIAFDKLKSVEDTNPNTQYWLVVITDGVFDKPENGTAENRKRFLNKSFEDYTSSVMPNETHPQITFLGIGNVISPDEDAEKGIYTYSASDANGIIGEMAKMADRISGRTRLQSSDIKQVDDKTIRVSSAIPLLNIVVFAQGSQAKVSKAMYGNEVNIPISRKVELGFPDYSDLVGGAFLLGDSSIVIGSGTYDITFDSKVDLEDVIILFEPALEMRMTVTVNGKEITDYKEFDNLHENDKVSVSCKIYEMGTDVEIDPSLMPPGTKFEVVITEDGNVAKQVSGKDMELAEYILKPVETEIKASVMIEGFNPIEYYERFTPTPPVHQVVYSMTADYGNDVKSVKLDGISSNKDLTVCFTVYADGVAMEDPAEVKALNPVISVSPEGNDGSVVYSNDGKIIFTPNKAKATSSDVGSFDVDVICTLDDGTTATLTYTVLISEYKVFAVDAAQSVKKTEFFDNQVAVSFYITKDGVQLDKSAVEKHISVLFNEEHSELKQDITVAPDGMITVRPYSEEQHTLTFRNWWINWAYYFGLEGD